MGQGWEKRMRRQRSSWLVWKLFSLPPVQEKEQHCSLAIRQPGSQQSTKKQDFSQQKISRQLKSNEVIILMYQFWRGKEQLIRLSAFTKWWWYHNNKKLQHMQQKHTGKFLSLSPQKKKKRIESTPFSKDTVLDQIKNCSPVR